MASPLLALIIFFSRKNPGLFLRVPHHSPYCLLVYIFIQHPRNRLFAVKHQKRAVLLAVNRLHPTFCFLLLFGADSLFCFIELHWIEALGLLPKPSILIQGSIQLSGIFLLLFFQSIKFLLHGRDVFRELIGSIFLGICQRRQKQILFRTQFLQILCQRRNFSRQFPVPEHMDSRE